MSDIRFYPIIRGIASYFLPKKYFTRPGSGGTFSGEYCYSVWMRHLYYLLDNQLFDSVSDIKNIAEIGPGDSLGIGICSIYTGGEQYFAFDVIEHANLEKNTRINQHIKDLFIRNEPVPNNYKQRFTAPELPTYSFPHEKLKFTKEEYLERYSEIESALRRQKTKRTKIEYIVPWMNSKRADLKDVDLIFSQAVMEHVSDIKFAYSEMYKWLKPGGVISHQIDFKTHEMTKEWNGHWFIDDTMWGILAHGRKYPMNRLPLSAHIDMIKEAGFKIKFVLPVVKPNAFKGISPIVPGVNFTEEDLTTSGALIQAIKE